ncbi:Succinate--hydroxymethylglutarate CoA-transferase [Oryzias melastigma]|uniref:Succinate--hydroxymethylglutarate CoA-transferase n=1 Tax=Oryzias melastigma TaxID=30732 RepID=A0A834L2L2_ORYME|nr:Succinate--hydroxymethylglutarate CoA-transferase [Oryzias melastigma]
MFATFRAFQSRTGGLRPAALTTAAAEGSPSGASERRPRGVGHKRRVLAGPFATMILGDLGAEVIKVEKPGQFRALLPSNKGNYMIKPTCCLGVGDDTRAWGPPFVGSESVYFLSINRNKKSLAVDLKNPRGAEVVRELAGVCDVLVENYLPGKLQEMGLGFEQLGGVNPQLIYCSISGYGQTGPQAQSPGYDSIASAVSGMMHITGPEDGEPVRPGVAMTDLATGLYAHGAIMAALLQRHKTGRGGHIDCNLLSSQVSCLSHIAANYLNAGKEARRWGTAHESIVPYQGFKTKDGHIVVAAGNDKQFVRVCQVLELIELTQDPNYKSNKLRVKNRKKLLHTLSQRFQQEKTADWLRRFEGLGVPVGPINSIREVFSEPQTCICLERFLAVVHPTMFLRFRPLRYRLLCCAVDWLLILLDCMTPLLVYRTILALLLICKSLLFFFILLYCGMRVLYVLKRPGPGDGGHGAESWNSMKKKAFKVIMITLVFNSSTQLLQLSLLGPVILYASITLILQITLVSLCISIVSSFITPLLYLHRAGKLPCINF